MKKTKILIPVLSVASMGAVVAPIVTMTSCANDNVFLRTNDMNYMGQIHDTVEAGENAWTLAKASTEYFQNARHIAEDSMTILAPYFGEYVLESIADHKNVRYSFDLAINNLSLGEEKEITVQTQTVKGRMISGEVLFKCNASYDYTIKQCESEGFSSAHTNEVTSMMFSFKNCFTSLQYNTAAGWMLSIFGRKEASDQWEMTMTTAGDRNVVAVLNFDGSQISLQSKYEETETFGAQYGDKDQTIFADLDYLPSTYLSKVAYKAE